MMFAILHDPIPVSINYLKGVLGVSHFAGQSILGGTRGSEHEGDPYN